MCFQIKKQVHGIGWITATWFGAGLVPIAPGTCGSLGAIPFAYIASVYAGPIVLIVGIVSLFLVGTWASNEVEKSSQKKDPGFIVVDEVVGQWIALLPLPCLYARLSSYFIFATIVLGFFTFRIFDIWKPWPIRHIEKKIPGGLGIMLDDVMAGIYALIITAASAAGMTLIS